MTIAQQLQAQGKAQGEANGEVRGIKKGALEKSRELALQLLHEGSPVSLIAKVTGLLEKKSKP